VLWVKKQKNKNMNNIINSIQTHSLNNIKIIIFTQDTILNKSIEEWPRCDCLLAFYSKNFPLDKCIEYYNKYKPLCLNNLEKQKLLLNRELILNELIKHKVPVLNQIIVLKDDYINNRVEEKDDYIILTDINGNKKELSRPFIEKPTDAESHDLYI